MIIAEPLQKAIDELSKLPSIGSKTAQRLALHILKSDNQSVEALVKAIGELKEKIRFCSVCFNISTEDVCEVCKSPKRDRSVLCVVEEASDVIAIEKTNEFNGLYHVLGGVLNPLANVTVESLKIKELLHRLTTDEIKEIILALNPNSEGDATSLYLIKVLKDFPIRISRIARGLPIGGDLEFADAATIGRAFIGRIAQQ
jgi:recombination protein RecR